MEKFEVTEREFAVITSDLKRASKYLDLLLAAKADPRSTASHNEALSVAAVIAYRRPFTPCDRHNPRSKTKRTPWVPDGVIADMENQELQELHEWMEELRDKTWAHTDEEAFKGSLIQAFPKAEIPKFKKLIQEVIDRLKVNPLLFRASSPS
jgi:hypothetical protein